MKKLQFYIYYFFNSIFFLYSYILKMTKKHFLKKSVIKKHKNFKNFKSFKSFKKIKGGNNGIVEDFIKYLESASYNGEFEEKCNTTLFFHSNIQCHQFHLLLMYDLELKTQRMGINMSCSNNIPESNNKNNDNYYNHLRDIFFINIIEEKIEEKNIEKKIREKIIETIKLIVLTVFGKKIATPEECQLCIKIFNLINAYITIFKINENDFLDLLNDELKNPLSNSKNNLLEQMLEKIINYILYVISIT